MKKFLAERLHLAHGDAGAHQLAAERHDAAAHGADHAHEAAAAAAAGHRDGVLGAREGGEELVHLVRRAFLLQKAEDDADGLSGGAASRPVFCVTRAISSSM